jgi:hypothetical protein
MMAACSNEWFLVQDGVTCHASTETMAYLSEYATVLPNYPSGSADLNPIDRDQNYFSFNTAHQRVEMPPVVFNHPKPTKMHDSQTVSCFRLGMRKSCATANSWMRSRSS